MNGLSFRVLGSGVRVVLFRLVRRGGGADRIVQLRVCHGCGGSIRRAGHLRLDKAKVGNELAVGNPSGSNLRVGIAVAVDYWLDVLDTASELECLCASVGHLGVPEVCVGIKVKRWKHRLGRARERQVSLLIGSIADLEGRGAAGVTTPSTSLALGSRVRSWCSPLA